MPKATFTNLSEEKSKHVTQVLINTFYNRSPSQVTVTEIVDALGMSRGAFYKYFTDISDAYYTTAKKCAQEVHTQIMYFIQENNQQFLFGLEQYLAWCADLNRTSDDWKSIQILTMSHADVYAKRTPIKENIQNSKMVKNWMNLLAANDFHFESGEESLYFLYFIERVVITSLQDFVVNNWSKDELMKDFKYKKKWIINGIKNN